MLPTIKQLEEAEAILKGMRKELTDILDELDELDSKL